ncbi:MAG: alpha/beta hydrolase family protein [Actinomycetota bacterium]
MSAAGLTTNAGPISLTFDGPPTPDVLVVLAHGAGGDMRGEFMEFFASELSDEQIGVCRFNFAYSEQGRKSPDRQDVLKDTYRAVVDHVRTPNRKLVLGGKSMGGRIASHIVADDVECDGLVFLGYPLHPPGRPERIRDVHLANIRVPMLFVEGTRDPFCPLDTLEKVRAKLSTETEISVIDDGDHSFKVRKSSGRSTKDAWHEAVDAVRVWVSRR